MKYLYLYIILLFSIKTLGQTIPDSQMIKKAQNTVVKNITSGIQILPNEKFKFTIDIFHKGDTVLIIGGDGKVLYMQTNEIGSFEITNGGYSQWIDYAVYRNGQQIHFAISENNKGTIIDFGTKEARISIQSQLSAEDNDMKNKHFVRFLYKSSYPLPYYDSFSLSLKKLPLPNSYTEPLSEKSIYGEKNIIVDTGTYLKFKNYIISHDPVLNTYTKLRKHNNFLMLIDVDYEHRYYLDQYETISFLKAFSVFLNREKINQEYIDRLIAIIGYARSVDNLPIQSPRDPN